MNIDTSAWGQKPPEFIQVLADLVESTGSKKAAADQIGIDRASVSTLLANKYPASTAKMEGKILAFTNAKTCPLLGEISGVECQKNRELPYIGSNQQRIALFRACRQCKHNPQRGDL